ncbi:[citrate (pro-3S)-lyase] ligase [Otariodibacter sp.]|uniref:[citrate (pro-3S)-lyase] ligase n=1 Tax=Otariodibacter sp. TaxID=3030919 RepID=UPI00262B2F5E|nr:[citrate (pro-3S)-lyase] ligase [Otariodibacter sp.]
MNFDRINITDHLKISQIESFLHRNNLSLDMSIIEFIVAYDDNYNIIACGGVAPNIIKCVAIDKSYRGQCLALTLITEVINLAYDLGYSELFIFTKPEYEQLFKQCGFFLISSAYPNAILLENSKNRLKEQCEKWKKLRVDGKKIGSIVMNANPFTLGHRYLIEQSLKMCDHLHVFVLQEDASMFSYQDRLALVKQGVQDLKNVSVHNSSPYIISKATFPDYFIKDKKILENTYLEIDLKIFRKFIAPSLGITHRFVGTEPICPVTSEYNKNMFYWLQDADMDAPPINVIEFERKNYHQKPISASLVRSLLQRKSYKELLNYVPSSTFSFLRENMFV